MKTAVSKKKKKKKSLYNVNLTVARVFILWLKKL